MPATVLVTGAAGFIGSRLAASLGSECRGLVRRPPAGDVSWQVVVGDLLEPEEWTSSLAGIKTVVHLAALTGKASATEHQRVNTDGTSRLVEACREQGVQRLIFVSTIAVRFPDVRRYPYAEAKRQAEEIVRGSGLDYVIVRPTMVLGAGSPILEALRRLASLPLMPIFGDGQTLVQPVHVHDLVRTLERLLRDSSFDGSVVEVGGPQRLSIEDLLRRIRGRVNGKAGPAVHLPMGLLLPLLVLGETVAYGVMPFTVGQLATFRFDGTAEDNQRRGDNRLRDIDSMIASGAL